MRCAVFSDVHSNLEAFERVIREYHQESIDEYFCLGDIVGYGADPQECISLSRQIGARMIAGNHDWAAAGILDPVDFNNFARQAVFWTSQLLLKEQKNFLRSLKLTYSSGDFTLVHGTLDAPQDFSYMIGEHAAKSSFDLMLSQICFVGHTHLPGVFIREKQGMVSYLETDRIKILAGKSYIINVGSVGQPRDGNPQAAFCIYDTDKREVLIKRAAYDVESARKKIVDRGLPRFLGDRLRTGG